MKRIVSLLLTSIIFLSCAAALISCEEKDVVTNTTQDSTREIPEETQQKTVNLQDNVTDFRPENGTLYIAYVYVLYVDSEGFAGDGTFRDGVFVKYKNADQQFGVFSTVRVEFYGENYKVESNTFTSYVDPDYPYDVTSEQTITKVESARLADSGAHEPVYDKPIIYLYPEKDTVCSVRLETDGELTCTYPEYQNGWSDFIAKPDGTLVFPDGKEYYALYWEGKSRTEFDFSNGFCVKGSETAEFLADILPRLGLSAREANEFIIYWLPRMQENAYNLISFQSEAYTESAKLIIDPAPDTLIRVFMAYKPLEEAVEIVAQEIITPERSGFTVVEWGGSEVR